MLSLQGIGATNGKGSGIAIIFKKNNPKCHDKFYGIEAKEIFFEIKELAIAEIEGLLELCNECEEEDILKAHILMLNDNEVQNLIFELIDEGEDLSKAIKIIQSNYFTEFRAMDNEVFSSKALDVEEVFDRLLLNIKKQDVFKAINKNFILICDDLRPTTIYDYPLEHLKGIVVKNGTFFSHGVIIAKSKNIPVVIGLGSDISKINQNDYLVIDCLSGKVIIISE